MANPGNIFRPRTELRPELACEIRPEGVVAARASLAKRGPEMAMAFAPLADGALAPGLKVPNLVDPPAVRLAMEAALRDLAARTKALTVIVPDAAARVLLLDFDSLPAKAQEALPVVRFRLRRIVPFEVDTAAVSYQVMAKKGEQLNVLVTVMPNEVLAEYEGVARDAGYEPGAVLPSTLAAAAGLVGDGAALMVNRAGGCVSTSLIHRHEMLLYRLLELPADAASADEDMAQAVMKALVWYEDTLQATPEVLYFAGAGGAQAAEHARWREGVAAVARLEDFAVPEYAAAVSAIPPGLAAGVVGALAMR